ncbi:MAG TPA: hypothetical protein VMW24_24285 [Sedimentisphaerales bacterium]|nr:hypothetical protein [Sedimentisphaerales bacterium]
MSPLPSAPQRYGMFDAQEEDIPMMTLGDMGVVDLEAVAPDLYAQVFGKGQRQAVVEEQQKKQQRDQQQADLLAACKGCISLYENAMKDETIRAQVLRNYAAELQQQNKRLAEQNAVLREQRFAVGASDEQLKEHFSKSQDLQDQFTGLNAYLAYVKNCVRRDRRGR